MRTKGWIFALVICLPSLCAAQDNRRNVVVPLADGGFVAFKSQTTGLSTNASAELAELQNEFSARAFADDNHVIHRVLLNAKGRYVFGYDLSVQALASARSFKISVTPLNPQVESKLLAAAEGKPSHIATLPRTAEPQTLDDGDSFTLDLLVNEQTGIKIVDFVKVSFDRGSLWNDRPGTVPRDFTLDAVALSLVNYKLSIDGNLVASGKPGTNFGGALVWCYIEGYGRFIFSLVPREGYQFQKAGIITDNMIEFTVGGRRYEWLSSAPILPTGGTWNLWVLHDPDYVPFGSQQVTKQEKGRIEKWDDSIKAVEAKVAKMRTAMPTTFHNKNSQPLEKNNQPAETERATQQTGNRFRVMVGAGDRMENIWPK
jgi:hypothetical protein